MTTSNGKTNTKTTEMITYAGAVSELRKRMSLRRLLCRRCARECETPGALWCDDCIGDVPEETRRLLEKGSDER